MAGCGGVGWSARSLAELVQVRRADEQMARAGKDLPLDGGEFGERMRSIYWALHGKNGSPYLRLKPNSKPILLRPQLELFKVG